MGMTSESKGKIDGNFGKSSQEQDQTDRTFNKSSLDQKNELLQTFGKSIFIDRIQNQ